MTISKLRGLIDAPTMVRNNIIFRSLSADDDFRYNVGITYSLPSDDLLHIQGFCSQLKVSNDKVSDAIIYCNEHNKCKHFPTAFYDMDDRDFNLSWSMVLKHATDECIRSHTELLTLAIWKFFVAVGKEF